MQLLADAISMRRSAAAAAKAQERKGRTACQARFDASVACRERLGGLLKYCHQEAA